MYIFTSNIPYVCKYDQDILDKSCKDYQKSKILFVPSYYLNKRKMTATLYGNWFAINLGPPGHCLERVGVAASANDVLDVGTVLVYPVANRIVDNCGHWSQIWHARPQPITRREVRLLNLTSFPRVESLLPVMQIPKVQIANLHKFIPWWGHNNVCYIEKTWDPSTKDTRQIWPFKSFHALPCLLGTRNSSQRFVSSRQLLCNSSHSFWLTAAASGLGW